MEPIINPLWFYLAGISENISIVLVLIGLAIPGIPMIAGALEEEFVLKKGNAIIGIVMLLLSTFIPDEATVYKMITVSCITPNNIELTADTLTDAIDYIVESIDELLEENDD